MPYFPYPPSVFKKTNTDDDPFPLVDLLWSIVTTAELRSDFMMSNDQNHQSVIFPASNWDRISAHAREVMGYRLHREQTGPGFVPDDVNEIADESVLLPLETEFRDLGVVGENQYFYKLGLAFNP